ELKIIEGTGHWLHAEKPDAFAMLCRRFLEQA
ncbi:MAG TPA: alpha/beta hydrolase, partial [Marinobacter hydrocarbonoclasticus]|nr:alpha/beta hydrolase [Marinobacter nauticus]